MTEKKLRLIEILEDRSHPEWDRGKFTRIQRLDIRNVYEDGSVSRPYQLDVASHEGYDAVAVLPYWEEEDGCHVMLLRSFRPALAFRGVQPERKPFLLEAIAGVLEGNEHEPEGVRRRAATEMLEEAGFRQAADDVVILGEPFYVSPGIYTEKIWVCAATVDPGRRETPAHDGSVMEELMTLHPVALEEARRMCRRGEIRDAKTEIALERLARRLTGKSGPSG